MSQYRFAQLVQVIAWHRGESIAKDCRHEQKLRMEKQGMRIKVAATNPRIAPFSGVPSTTKVNIQTEICTSNVITMDLQLAGRLLGQSNVVATPE